MNRNKYIKTSNNFVNLYREFMKELFADFHKIYNIQNKNVLFQGFTENRFDYISIFDNENMAKVNNKLIVIANNKQYELSQEVKPYRDRKHSKEKYYKQVYISKRSDLLKYIVNIKPNKKNYIYTHRLVGSMLKPVQRNFDVHHLNKHEDDLFSSLDNRYNNLLLLPEEVHQELDNRWKMGLYTCEEYNNEINKLKDKYRNRQTPINSQLLFKVLEYRHIKNHTYKEIIINIKKTLKISISETKIRSYLKLVGKDNYLLFYHR